MKKNNYNEEFKVVSNDDTYSSMVNAYSKYSKSYVIKIVLTIIYSIDCIKRIV